MDVGLAWRGAVFGVAIAAPVGPIAVLLIRRTLTRGRAVGFASGLGAATADLTYGLLVALGLTAVTERLMSAERGLQAVGGIVLLALGIRTLRAAPAAVDAADTSRRSLAAAYASTYALTLTNPATIVLFLAVFASVGVVTTAGSGGDALTIAAGVALGSAAWQLSLCAAVSLLRGRLTDARMRWVNVASGLVIAGFGAAALASAAA